MRKNNLNQIKEKVEELFKRMESLGQGTLRSNGVSETLRLGKSEEEAELNKRTKDYLLNKSAEPIDKNVIGNALKFVIEDKLK